MLAGVGRTTQNDIWLYGSKGTLHLDLDAKKLSIALQEAGESDFRLRSWTLVCSMFMSHVYRRLSRFELNGADPEAVAAFNSSDWGKDHQTGCDTWLCLFHM